MARYDFALRISHTAYLEYYRGTASAVVVTTTSGQRLQFPARFLVPFVSEAGISGEFVLTCDSNNKCIQLERRRP